MANTELSDFISRGGYESRGRGAGCVYFLFDIASGFVKIGHSNQLRFRLTALSSKTDIIFLFALDFGGTDFTSKNIELLLHRYFADKRVRGEWFDLSKKELFKIYRFAIPTKARIIKTAPQGSGPLAKRRVRSFYSDVRGI